MSTEQIKYIEAQLVNGLHVIHKQHDRRLMREAILRIRQLRGILEVRAKLAAQV